METKTHFRKAFDSPYLSAADIVEPTRLTIARVALEPDRTKKTKDTFNTAHFVERELRPGEPLKPMILNATNSKTLKGIAGTPFIEDWRGIPVMVYVETNVKFGKDITEGLRIARIAEPMPCVPGSRQWEHAKNAYRRDGNLSAVLAKATMTPEHQAQLIAECGGPRDAE